MTTQTIAKKGIKYGVLKNYVGGQFVEAEAASLLDVTNPTTGEVIAQVPMSTKAEVDRAIRKAQEAQHAWQIVPIREKVQVFYRLKQTLEREFEDLARLVSEENGKNFAEAKAEVSKGIECLEYGISLPQLMGEPVLEVSTGVQCRQMRYPLGIVAGITPFNFPFMVPFWMIPQAIGVGNALILKPSEVVPVSSMRIAEHFKEAGLPDGIFTVVNGGQDVVEALCDHPAIRAIGFVGSTKVARIVYARASANGKRCLALGGAKNHLIVLPDAEDEMTARNVTDSFTGCAGQRCMAASVMLAVGNVDHIIQKIVAKAGSIRPGFELGAVISLAARDRIHAYIDAAEKAGAKILLDGRNVRVEGKEGGYYVGPTIIHDPEGKTTSSHEEIFGPVLTIRNVENFNEALRIENENPYGNAAAIYTTSGSAAREFTHRASAGMVGVNVGVPVPREPFPFGGWNDSRFGVGEITGPGGIDLWSQSKKITEKWELQKTSDWMS